MRSAPPSLSWTGWSLSQRDASYWSFAHSARCQRAPRLQDYAEKGSRHRPGGNTASMRHWRVRYAPEFAAPVRDRPDYRTDELSPSCKSP